jgi:small subunit ribosomal protein S4
MLEMRLDNAVFRLGFAESRDQARQIINHGHIEVDNKKVTIPSFLVKTGNIIKISEKSKRSKIFSELKDKLKNAQVPGWLNLNKDEWSGKILHQPKIDEVNTNINAQMIVEFYSR